MYKELFKILIISDDNDYRTSVADQVYEYTKSLNGVVSVERNDKKQKPQIVIDFDYNKISKYNLLVQLSAVLAVPSSVVTLFSILTDWKDVSI